MIRGISPRWAYERARYQAANKVMESYRHRATGIQEQQQRRADSKHLFASYRHSEYRRSQRSRSGLTGTADAHLDATERENLMYRSMDLERNNAIAKGMFDRVVDNVGTMTPQARSGDDKWDTLAEDRFAGWAEDQADIRRILSFSQIQRLAVRSVIRDGDVGFVLTNGSLQPVEANRIVSPSDVDNDNVIQGVETDEVGKPVGYWVANTAARNYYIKSADAEKIPAHNFIHLYRPERFSQTRGCPSLAPCMGYFDQLDSYIEAELVSAQVAACLSVVITGDERTAPNEPFMADEEDESGEEQAVMDLEPGVIYNLSGVKGGNVSVVNPNKPPQQFPDFVGAILRFLGLPLGLPIELVSLNMQYGSYSSARLSLLQAYRVFRGMQSFLISRFLRRIWQWKVSQFIKQGDLPEPKGGMWAAWRHVWSTPGWEWIDPEREVRANALALDRGMATLEEFAQEKGMDAKGLMERRAREIQQAMVLAQEIGLSDWRDILRADTKTAVGGA